MMKKLSVIVVTVFIAIPAFSQLNWGIKAGVSTTSISMDDAKQLVGQAGTYTIEALKSANFGYHGGIFVRLSLLGIYIQPEILFASTENKYNITNPGSTAKEVIQKLNNLSIPVMVGAKLGPLRINLGPAASLALSTPGELIDDPDLTDMYSKTSFGYQAGIGLDIFKKLTIDVRYEGSLKKYQNKIENITGTTVNLDNRPNAFLFSLGLMF